jgi:WD40 repeat protein
MQVYNGVRKHAREIGPNGMPDPASTQPVPKRSRKSANPSANNANAERHANAQPPSLPAADTNDPSSNSISHNRDATGTGMDVDEVDRLAVQPANGQSYPPRGAAEFDETSAGTNGVQMDARMDVDPPPAPDPAEREPQAQEQIIEPQPLISTLASGENVGVQVAPAKVAQLAPATAILAVADNQHVTQVSWHPTNPNVLTTSGQQFCGLWNMPGANGTQQAHYKTLVDPSPDILITAIAWEPTGSVLAIATYASLSGRIYLFDGVNLSLLTTLPASQRAVISLRWLPSCSRLVGVAASDDESLHEPSSSSVLLWDLSGDSAILAPTQINVREVLLDVDCVSHIGSDIVCIAGDDVVYQCRAIPGFEIEQRWESSRPPRSLPPASWTFVKCTTGAINNKVTVIAASADSMHLWMPAQDILLREVHSAPITGLQMRPRLPRYPDMTSFQEFATSSMDGTIRGWRFTENPNLLSPLFKVTLGHMSPVMALSYSLDGFCLAGAGYDKLRIWNADQAHHQALAVWDSSNTHWRGASLKEDDAMSNGGLSSMNGDHPTPNSDHSLSWDASSKKVVFALGCQVSTLSQFVTPNLPAQLAIIDFQR